MSVLTAGFIVLAGYCPLWGHEARSHHESVFILMSERLDASVAGHAYLAKRGRQRWKDLSPEEQRQLRQKYKEWQSLPPEEKEKIRRRMQRLKNMSPQERESYHQLYRKWRHLPPSERRQLENELNNWENLSPRQQEEIRRRFMK